MHPVVSDDDELLQELGSTIETFPNADLGRLKVLCVYCFQWDEETIEEKFRKINIFQGAALRSVLNEVAENQERAGARRGFQAQVTSVSHTCERCRFDTESGCTLCR